MRYGRARRSGARTQAATAGVQSGATHAAGRGRRREGGAGLLGWGLGLAPPRRGAHRRQPETVVSLEERASSHLAIILPALESRLALGHPSIAKTSGYFLRSNAVRTVSRLAGHGPCARRRRCPRHVGRKARATLGRSAARRSEGARKRKRAKGSPEPRPKGRAQSGGGGAPTGVGAAAGRGGPRTCEDAARVARGVCLPV
jgi:hypothetical protein